MNETEPLGNPTEKNAVLTGNVNYATFNYRFFAALIDMTVVSMFGMPLTEWIAMHLYAPIDFNQFVLFFAVQHSSEELRTGFFKLLNEQDVAKKVLINNLIQLAIIGCYILPFWFKFRSTPGKMLLGLEIRDASTLELMSHKQVILRFFGYVISGIPLSLGFIWMAFSKRKQGWHDMIAHTVVVKKERKKKVEAP